MMPAVGLETKTWPGWNIDVCFAVTLFIEVHFSSKSTANSTAHTALFQRLSCAFSTTANGVL